MIAKASPPNPHAVPVAQRQTLAEAIEFLGVLSGLGAAAPNLFASDGNLWQQVGGAGASGGAFWAAYYWMSSIWFNRLQRYAARFAFMTNGYSAAAINELTTLALGEGFNYSSKNKTVQKQVETWIKLNDWHERSIEGFLNWLIDGEVFIRIDGQGESSTVSYIDPDLIYSSPTDRQDYFCGCIFGDTDTERPNSFRLWNKPFGDAGGEHEDVPAAQIQHRANRHFGQKRGFSWALPVLKDCFQADGLTGNLMGTAGVLSKFALIRQHQVPQGGAELMRAQIQADQAAYGPPIGQNGTPPIQPTESAERYPEGAIVDSSASTEYKTLDGVNYAQFGEALDMALRKISSHFFLPMGIFAQDKSERGSYAAEIASGSWNERNIKKFQDKWKRRDLALMAMCGIDVSEVDVTAPEIATPDKAAAVQEEDMMIRNKCRSRQTVCESHGGDWEQEKQRMLAEKKDLADLFEEPANELAAENRNTSEE
ncbi:MAG TPA: phage portal protein [Pirellulales bacterium]|nr:phage portal protein [Pirellulales bacterium]